MNQLQDIAPVYFSKNLNPQDLDRFLLNIDKTQWKKVKLGEVCEFVRGVTYAKDDELNDGTNGIGILRSNNVDFQTSKIVFDNLKFIKPDAKVKPEQRLLKNDILISVANSKEQTGKVGFSNFDTDYYFGGFMGVLRPFKTKIFSYFLFLNLISDKFINFIAGKNQGTTNIWNITFNRIQDFSFYLPNESFQEQFASLLWEIETQIEKASQVENDLKNLKKGLLHEFFGKKEGKKVKFGEVAKHKTSTERNPLKKGINRYVGLEHLETEKIQISSWGDLEKDNVTFTKYFNVGDVLFGRRRAYLKKAGLADFDGICSSDILIFEAIEDKIYPNLFPYIVQNDSFFDFAVSKSSGSLSPRSNWSEIKDFEFYLPNLEKQQEMSELLWGFEAQIAAIRQTKTDLQALKRGLINEIIG